MALRFVGAGGTVVAEFHVVAVHPTVSIRVDANFGRAAGVPVAGCCVAAGVLLASSVYAAVRAVTLAVRVAIVAVSDAFVSTS